MRLPLVLALLGLFFAASAAAQSGASPSRVATAAPVTERAREVLGLDDDLAAARYADAYAAALDFRLAAAGDAFRALARDWPGSPAGVYGMEAVALWTALMTEEDGAYDRFYALNDSLLTLVEGDAMGRPILAASAKLHRALAFGRQERYARAGNSFRDACGVFRDLTGPDAMYGQGVCEVAAGAVPRKYRWLARLFGFRGTVSGGLAKLDAASLSDGALAVDATVAFAIADASLNERRAGAADRLAALADAHPASPGLGYLAGFHLFLDRRADEAEVVLRRAASNLTAEGVQPVPFVQAHLGLTLFRQHRFAEAAPLLEDYARTFRGRALVAQATLYAGLAYELEGDRRRAEALYRRVRASRDYDSDLSAAREAEHRLEAPMTASERTLVLATASYDAGRYDEAVSLLQPIVTDRSISDVDRAEAAYLTGRARQAQEDWTDALRHYQLAIDRPGDPLAKWGPWSLYHAGEVYETMGDLDQAAARYRSVLENEDEFDYHKALEQRTRAALDRIGR